MTWPHWLGRAVRNRHRHAIEQVSHRWRGGRRGDSGRTRSKFDFHTGGLGGGGGNRPAIQEVVDERRARTEEEFGSVPKTLPAENSMPMRIEGTRKLVTERMLNQACALILLFFTSIFMYAQFYCSWWWFEEKGGKNLAWITRVCDHIVTYGWGVRSALVFQDGAGGKSGNMLSYFKVFEWMNGFGVMNELDAPMPEIGLKAIAAALECKVEKISDLDLLKLPLIPQMFAVAFVGVLCYLPVLHVICCCGKRCRMVCKYLKFTDDETDIICSDKIWVSYMPLYSEGGKFLAFQFYHPEKLLGNTKDVKRLHAWLAGAADEGKLPIKADMINPKLATLATMSSYYVAKGKQCGTSTCRGGVICVRAEQEKHKLLRMVKGREVLDPPPVDLFKKRGKGKGMTDDQITKLVVDWRDFHAWRRRHSSESRANWRLFRTVVTTGLFKPSAFGKKGDVLGKLLERYPGHSMCKVSPDIAKRIVDRPWKGASKNAAKNATATVEEPAADVLASIGNHAQSAWDWWLKRPEEGLACRADKFKWWHWIGNKHKVSACAENQLDNASTVGPRNLISTQVSASEWAKEGPHQRQFDEEHAFDEERPITIFSEDNGDDIEQPDDDEDGSDAAAAAPIDMTAVEAKVAELVGGFPKWFVRGDSYRAERGDVDWSSNDRDVGKILVRPNYVGTNKWAYEEKTYAVCVAVRERVVQEVFGPRKMKQFRVVYGVYRRYHSGNPVGDIFETIDGQDRFKGALPEEPLEVATAKALREALDARPAAPPSSGAPASAPTEDPKITELRDYIRKRDGDPSLLDGWVFDRVDSGKNYVQPGTGMRFQRKRVLELLGVGAATSRRTSTRETRTRAEAEDAEDARFARMPSCVRREGFKCISCDFEAKSRPALERHRAASHQDEPSNQRTPGEPCGVCRKCLRPPIGTWDHRRVGEPGYRRYPLEPGDVGPPNCGNASASRTQAFALEQMDNRHRFAEHEAGRRPRPPAPAPPKKPPKKKHRTDKKKR